MSYHSVIMPYEDYKNACDAIRTKTGSNDLVKSGDLASKIQGISGGIILENIPTGYTKCDYIKFNKAQTVDTGIICNQNTKIKIIYTREDSSAMYLYGVASTNNVASVTAYLSSGGSWRFGAKSASFTISTSADIIHTAIVSKAGYTMDSGNSSLSSVADFETVGTLVIGAVRNASGTLGNSQFVGKILSFEMWSGTTQTLKLIPVTDGNGSYRFWDIIGEKFHDSITTTPLSGGIL